MMYEIYAVSGVNDGKMVGAYDSLTEARSHAKQYEKDHADELNPTWGGTMILDDAGAVVF